MLTLRHQGREPWYHGGKVSGGGIRTRSIDVELFFELLDQVKEHFHVRDSYLRDGTPTFEVNPPRQLEEKVEALRDRLRAMGLRVILKMKGDSLQLQVAPILEEAETGRWSLPLNYPLLLFIATLVTVTISGYFNAKNFIGVLEILGRSHGINEGIYTLELTASYTISLMSVLGLHELGHTIACRLHRIPASLPIFIPGIPLITPGTFGALIRQRRPALNRNQLFDIGLSGPLVGFITAITVSAIGYSMSIPISREEYLLITNYTGGGQLFFLPLLFQGLAPYIFPAPNSFTHILHPIALSAWMATLLTFLNIFPIGQLDGGHITRALLGAKWHRRLSYAMVLVMILTGWWSMALLIVLFLRNRHPGTMDDATGVSNGRRALSVTVAVIFASCFTLSPDSPLLYLLHP